MRTIAWKITTCAALIVLLLSVTRCGSTPEPMAIETPLPSGVEVIAIHVDTDNTNDLTQTKEFDQCEASSPLKPEVRFSQSQTEGAEDELVIRGEAEGELGLSAVAKVTIGGAVEQKWASSRSVTTEYSEGAGIEVPAHTRQAYTFTWKEIRRLGTVEYLEDGIPKGVQYEYRIGLELVRTQGKDLPCDEAETVPDEGTGVPAGYHIYDDFSAADAIDVNWWWDNEHELCAYHVESGQLFVECTNDTAQAAVPTLHPSHAPDEVVGVAADILVEQAGGPLQVVTKWQEVAVGGRWAYHLELDTDAVRAVRYNLADGYNKPTQLGDVTVGSGAAHRLQIERTDDQVLFLVDGTEFAADSAAHISPQLKMYEWVFDFLVWEGGNKLVGRLDGISTKSDGSPIE